MSRIVAPTERTIEDAVQILKSGGLIGMPTETVYGLAANALDGEAVAKIYDAKGRPAFNPLIAHFHSLEQAESFAQFSDTAKDIATAFWPGPITLILPRKSQSGISELATAGLDTIAVRVPAHDTARALIKAANAPLVAPSANISGSISPTTPAHVADGLGDKLDMILAAGACKFGLESTVLDLTGDTPIILRPGAITAEDLEPVLGHIVAYDQGQGADVKSPGMLLKHYAPNTPVRLNAIDIEPGEALLAFTSDKFIGIKGGGSASDLPDTARRNLSDTGDLYQAAANLFAMLKDLDRPEHIAIAVMNIPENGLGIAINDRLKRAAEGSK